MPTNNELDLIVPDNNIGYEDKINAFLVAKGVDSVIDIDSCGGLHTIDHAHHEIHEGDYWFADDISTSLALNGVYEWLLVTPDEDRYLHSLPQLVGTGEFEFQSYEGVAVTGNGTEIPILNRNRALGGTTTLKLYKNPTGANITGCPLMRSIRTGAGKSVGESRAESELILKKNTKYLFRLTARTAGIFVSAHLNGYFCGIGA